MGNQRQQHTHKARILIVEDEAVILDRLNRAAAVLFPVGAPQERVLSPLSLLATEGPGLPRRLLDTLDPSASSGEALDTHAHHVLRIA